RKPIERQVLEPDVREELQPTRDLAEDLAGNRGVLFAKGELGEERLRFTHGERRGAVDRAVADAHVARLAAQPGALAVRAGQIPAVPAQEHADVHLVLLPLQ